MILPILATILKLVFFLIVSVFIFYLPGRCLLRRKDKELGPEETIVISYGIGIVLFTVLAVVLGIIKMRLLALPLLAFLDFYALKQIFPRELIAPFIKVRKDRFLLLLLFLGVIIQGSINFPSGFRYPGGYYFWSSQGHDGLWHVAVMQEIANHFPPTNPLYAGHPLVNYHYAVDILMGEFYRLFPFFGSLDLYFRFFPVIFSLLIGLAVFSFTLRRWHRAAALWAVFFTYCCGSFGYLVLLLKGQFPLGGETVFWASQGNTILGNPPHAMGLILLTMILLLLEIWEKSKERFWLYSIAFLGFSLAIVKISSGMIFVFALGLSGLYLFWKEKRIELLLSGIGLAITNFILLKLVSPAPDSFLLFEPLWFPRTMMVSRLSNVDWELRRQHYIWKNTWHSWLRVVQLETEAVLIFIIGNSGIRIIGFWECLKKIGRKFDVVDCFIFSSLFFSVAIVLFFVQKGVIYNFIQFFQIYLHLLGILAAVAITTLLAKLRNRPLRVAIALIIILLAIPTVVGNFFDFYGPGKVPLSKVTPAEEEALNWLKNNSSSQDVVLTKPFIGGGEWRYSSQPWPISAWYSTPYVFVFSGRYGYLTGEEQLMIMGYKTEGDLRATRAFFTQIDLAQNQNFLKEKGIGFIYVRKDELEKPLLEKNNGVEKVFENNEVIVFKVIKNAAQNI